MERLDLSLTSITNCLALNTIYPAHPWDVTKLKNVRKGYWRDITNQRAFLDRLAKRMSILKQNFMCLRDYISEISRIGTLLLASS